MLGLLRDAGLAVQEYESLLIKNQKTPDDTVLKSATSAGYVIVTKDGAMDTDELEFILAHKARVIVLTDKTGGVPHFAAALICASEKVERLLLDCPVGPLVVRLSRDGAITKIRGAQELTERYNRTLTARIARGKRISQKHKKIGLPVGSLGI